MKDEKIIIVCTLFGFHSPCMALERMIHEPEQENELRLLVTPNNALEPGGMLRDDLAVELNNLSLDDSCRDSPEALIQHILDVAQLGRFRVNQGLASEGYINNKKTNLTNAIGAFKDANTDKYLLTYSYLQDDLSFLPRAENTKAEEAAKSAKNVKGEKAVKNLDLISAISG